MKLIKQNTAIIYFVFNITYCLQASNDLLQGYKETENLKDCIIVKGLNDQSFINCYGRNFSKLEEKLSDQLKTIYFEQFQQFFSEIQNLCQYDKTPCLWLITLVEENQENPDQLQTLLNNELENWKDDLNINSDALSKEIKLINDQASQYKILKKEKVKKQKKQIQEIKSFIHQHKGLISENILQDSNYNLEIDPLTNFKEKIIKNKFYDSLGLEQIKIKDNSTLFI